VDLARGRDVDDHIGLDVRSAPEDLAGYERASGLLGALLDAQRVGTDLDAPLGEAAFADDDLAASADPASTADRVEVDAELARRVEDGLARSISPSRPEGVKTIRGIRVATRA
jgi:hypothetical protein